MQMYFSVTKLFFITIIFFISKNKANLYSAQKKNHESKITARMHVQNITKLKSYASY